MSHLCLNLCTLLEITSNMYYVHEHNIYTVNSKLFFVYAIEFCLAVLKISMPMYFVCIVHYFTNIT